MIKEFLAEIRQVQSRKLVSNDIEIKVVLSTDDTSVLDLGKIESDKVVKVVIEDEG